MTRLEVIRERLRAMTPERRALAESLLAEKGIIYECDRPQRQERTPTDLTVKQESLWKLKSRCDRGAFYHVGIVLEADATTDELAAAWEAVATRHEVLHTSYGRSSPEAYMNQGLPSLARASVTDQDDPKYALSVALSTARRLGSPPFDLSRPPVRPLLLEAGPQANFLVLVAHDIALDVYGVRSVLAPQLERVLAGESPGASLPLRVPDVAAWQRSSLRGGELAHQVRRSAADLQSADMLDVPSGGDRQAERVPISLPWPATLASGLRASRFAVVLAAWAVALATEFGRSRVPIGVCTSGRFRDEVSGVLGNLANTLPLTVPADAPFPDVVAAARGLIASAIARADAPFESVLAETLPAGALVEDEDIRVRLTVHDPPENPVRLRIHEVDFGFAKCALSLETTVCAGYLHGDLVYRPAAIDAAVAHRLVDTVTGTLTGASPF